MDFISTVVTASATAVALLGLALTLFKTLLTTRLAASVKHEFDGKLANMQADLRKTEEQFKADLRGRDAQIDALQRGALSALASRQAAVDKRMLEAVDQLWASFNALAPARSAAHFMVSARISADKALKAAEADLKVRQLFADLVKVDTEAFRGLDAWRARPHVSVMAWALYRAYEGIVFMSVLQVKQIQAGLGQDFIDYSGIRKVAKVALPLQADFIDRAGADALPLLLEQLEHELLAEFSRMLHSSESDLKAVERARQILSAVDEAAQMPPAGGTAGGAAP